MSMPNIPDEKQDIDKKHSIDLLLASIGAEELGLADIISAEAEKIQFILGTLENNDYRQNNPPTLPELIQADKSVEQMMKKVIEKEILLDFKLEDAIKLTELTSATEDEKNDNDDKEKECGAEIHDVSYSVIYTGNGGNRVGSTTVSFTLTLSDGTGVPKSETLDDINETTSKEFYYTIGNCDIAVMIIVTAEGKNNNMEITGATATVTSSS